MVAASLRSGVAKRRAAFEVYARNLPDGRAYGVIAGADRVVHAIKNFRFTSDALNHLKNIGVASDSNVIEWLRSYRFRGDILGYPDGELFFPYSPILTVEGDFAECVVLETVILSTLNHDCAIASAAARMRDAARNRRLLEGGSRRTDPEAAVAAARAAYIGGFDATSNLEAGRRWGIPTGGTVAHAFMMAHDSERDAFAAQRDTLGVDSTYLVDTFDITQAIREAVGIVGTGIGAIRIDSGDLKVSSAEAKALLNKLGAINCRIVISGDLDEFKIAELEKAEAPIHTYLVGTNLATGSGHPTASMIYKLVAIRDDEKTEDTETNWRPVSKFSAGKSTVGNRKLVYRTIDTDGFLFSETLRPSHVEPPDESDNTYTPQVPMMSEGKQIYSSDIATARRRCAKRLKTLRPHDRNVYPVNSPAVPTFWEGWDS